MRFPITNYLNELPSDIRVKGASDFLLTYIRSKKLTISEIARKTGVSYRVYFRYLKENRAIPLGILRATVKMITADKRSYDLVMRQIYGLKLTYKSFASSANEVTLPKWYDKRLCYLIGVLHDGTVYADEQKNQYVVQFWQKTDKNLMEITADYLSSVFGLRPRKYKDYIQLSSKVVVEFLRRILRIPHRHEKWNAFLVKELPWQLQKYQIAGFYDAEGWCGGKDDPRIKFSQKNPEKLREIKTLFEKHGIRCGEVLREREIFAVYISGLESSIKFAREIARASNHSEKRAKLVELLEYVGRPPLIRGT